MRLFVLTFLIAIFLLFSKVSIAGMCSGFEERECWPIENLIPYLKKTGWEKLASGLDISSKKITIFYNKECNEILVLETVGSHPNSKICIRYALEEVDKKWGLFN